jgi:hypothetical protein
MRPSRFKVRTLLILVMLAGVGVGGYVLRRRSAEYRRLAESAMSAEMELAELASGFRGIADDESRWLECFSNLRPAPFGPERVAAARRVAGLPVSSLDEIRADVDEFRCLATVCERRRDRQAGIKLKYQYAARYPWLPVEPDPPVPE